MISLHDDALAIADAVNLDTLQESGPTGPRRLEGEGPADESDAPVSQGNDVLDRLGDAFTVVDTDIAGQRVHLSHIQKNNGHAAMGKFVEKWPVDFRCHNGHPIDLPLNHAAHADAHAFRAVIGVGHDDLVPAMDGSEFEALHQFGEKRIHNIGEDQTEHPASSGNQRPRLRIGVVPKLTNHPPYFLSRFWPDQFALVDGARNRRRRQVSPRRHFLDVHDRIGVALDSPRIIAFPERPDRRFGGMDGPG